MSSDVSVYRMQAPQESSLLLALATSRRTRVDWSDLDRTVQIAGGVRVGCSSKFQEKAVKVSHSVLAWVYNSSSRSRGGLVAEIPPLRVVELD
jgi:hypothetical protein